MDRTLQRARPAGGRVASLKMRPLTSGAMVGLRPLRGWVLQRPEPFADKAGPGLGDGIGVQADLVTDLEVGSALSRQQEGPRPSRFVAFARAGLGQLLQR